MIKVDNAIIMAAGMSTRFVPLSLVTHKALIPVKGEVLIERLITQLKEKNINDILIVTGYRAQDFEYLKDKYQVRLVHNPDYRVRNNHSSLYRVKDYLGNSLICSADNYYTENVFSEFEDEPYYSSIYIKNKTDEWCIQADKQGYINNITIGGKDSDIMIGHAFFDEMFSKTFINILEEVYDNPGTYPQLWEAIYMEHLDELKLKIKRHEPDQILEFDSLKDLQKFDKSYKQHIDNEYLNKITKELDTKIKKIKKIKPLYSNNELIGFQFKNQKKKYRYLLDKDLLFVKSRLISGEHIHEIKNILKDQQIPFSKDLSIFKLGGLTNNNYLVDTKNEKLVVRLPGKGTNELINRKQELECIEAIQETNLDVEILYFNPVSGVKISRYIDDAMTLNKNSLTDHLRRLADNLKKLHQSKISIPIEFDVFGKIEYYENLIKNNTLPDYQETKGRIKSLKHKIKFNDHVLCHNDPLPENNIVTKDHHYLIDWEYAGTNDPFWDVAAPIVEAELSKKDERRFLKYYFDREPNKQELINLEYQKVLMDFLWSLWGLYLTEQGNDYLDYTMMRYHRALKYLKNVERLLADE